MKGIILGLASAGYVGYFPWAPGTAGTLVGVLVFLLYSPFPPLIYLLSTAALFALACWVSEKAEVILGQRDSPKIVIDEVVGYLITMAFLPCTLTTMAGGFLFFRVFDIIKPPPAGVIDRRMAGGPGLFWMTSLQGSMPIFFSSWPFTGADHFHSGSVVLKIRARRGT